jgi:hypothetical protein
MKIADLNKEQVQYIKEHALYLFEATMLQPNDEPEDILASTCFCCQERRRFLKDVIELK